MLNHIGPDILIGLACRQECRCRMRYRIASRDSRQRGRRDEGGEAWGFLDWDLDVTLIWSLPTRFRRNTQHQLILLCERSLASPLSLKPGFHGFRSLHPRYKTSPTSNGLVGLVTPQTHIQNVEDLVYGMHGLRMPLGRHC